MAVKKTRTYVGHPSLEPAKKFGECVVVSVSSWHGNFELRQYKAAMGHPPLNIWLHRQRHPSYWDRWVQKVVDADNVSEDIKRRAALQLEDARARGII